MSFQGVYWRLQWQIHTLQGSRAGSWAYAYTKETQDFITSSLLGMSLMNRVGTC